MKTNAALAGLVVFTILTSCELFLQKPEPSTGRTVSIVASVEAGLAGTGEGYLVYKDYRPNLGGWAQVKVDLATGETEDVISDSTPPLGGWVLDEKIYSASSRGLQSVMALSGGTSLLSNYIPSALKPSSEAPALSLRGLQTNDTSHTRKVETKNGYLYWRSSKSSSSLANQGIQGEFLYRIPVRKKTTSLPEVVFPGNQSFIPSSYTHFSFIAATNAIYVALFANSAIQVFSVAYSDLSCRRIAEIPCLQAPWRLALRETPSDIFVSFGDLQKINKADHSVETVWTGGQSIAGKVTIEQMVTDGAELVFCAGNTIYRWDGSAVTTIWSGQQGSTTAFQVMNSFLWVKDREIYFIPDQNRVETALYRFDSVTGQLERLAQIAATWMKPLEGDPEHLLFWDMQGGNIRVFDKALRTVVGEVAIPHGYNSERSLFTLDGADFLFVIDPSESGGVWRQALAKGEPNQHVVPSSEGGSAASLISAANYGSRFIWLEELYPTWSSGGQHFRISTTDDLFLTKRVIELTDMSAQGRTDADLFPLKVFMAGPNYAILKTNINRQDYDLSLYDFNSKARLADLEECGLDYQIQRMVSSGRSLFAIDSRGLHRLDLEDWGVDTLSTDEIKGLDVNGTHVYWSTDKGIFRASVLGTAVERLYEGMFGELMLTEDFIYVIQDFEILELSK